jgi:hypothetical protein
MGTVNGLEKLTLPLLFSIEESVPAVCIDTEERDTLSLILL